MGQDRARSKEIGEGIVGSEIVLVRFHPVGVLFHLEREIAALGRLDGGNPAKAFVVLVQQRNIVHGWANGEVVHQEIAAIDRWKGILIVVNIVADVKLDAHRDVFTDVGIGYFWPDKEEDFGGAAIGVGGGVKPAVPESAGLAGPPAPFGVELFGGMTTGPFGLKGGLDAAGAGVATGLAGAVAELRTWSFISWTWSAVPVLGGDVEGGDGEVARMGGYEGKRDRERV